MVGLGHLPGYLSGGQISSSAQAVSADGSVVAGMSCVEQDCEAFRWTADEGMVGLGDLPGGEFYSVGMDVSADGFVVVGRSTSASGSEAFRWTADEGMVGLGDLPGERFFSWGLAVSADGSVVVGRGTSASGREAFRWTAETGMVGLGHLPGENATTTAFDVSSDGSVVVGSTSSNWASNMWVTEAFRWTAETGMVGLGHLSTERGTPYSQADAVSADGSVIVGTSTSKSVGNVFIWDEARGMRSLQELLMDLGLDLSGWDLSAVIGLSADGRTIVGTGTNPNGVHEAWLAVLVPEPGAGLLAGIGLAGFFVRRRHGIA
jgi:probable HAF family extracellular repeat protein